MSVQPPPRIGPAVYVLLIGLLSGSGGTLEAQGTGQVPVHHEVFAGGEIETYLRNLQVAGSVDRHPWSIRGFSQGDVERLLPNDSTHPWSDRYDLRPDTAPGPRFAIVAPRVGMIYNSLVPYSRNDGPVWAGRGLTTTVQAGVSFSYGPLSAVIAPVAFRAENQDFELLPSATPPFGDPAGFIDLPQRFGDDAYSRIDPGESTIRVDIGPIAAGVSTASQIWGPAGEYPIILGNNAGGFPHVFAGTSRPLDVWIGSAHGKLVWGDLRQSPYSDVEGSSSRRFMSGVVATFTPRGVPGLEVGVTRFFHTPWPAEGLTFDRFLKPLEGFLKVGRETTPENTGRNDIDNQLVSLFGRWVFPSSGFEVYAEYGREDHSWDMRDLVLEPDQLSAYALGVRRVWARDAGRMTVLRAELANGRENHLQVVRQQGLWYTHWGARQGHTVRGQLLGSPALFGGSGALVGLDHYHPGGRLTLQWRGDFPRSMSRIGARTPAGAHVSGIHTFGAEALLFAGRLEVTGAVNGSYEVHRRTDPDASEFSGGGFNLQALLSVLVRM